MHKHMYIPRSTYTIEREREYTLRHELLEPPKKSWAWACGSLCRQGSNHWKPAMQPLLSCLGVRCDSEVHETSLELVGVRRAFRVLSGS